jgi:hypothetical protein
MGLDGVILIAFILGFPANEIVLPIIIMAYLAQGSILELDSLAQMKALFSGKRLDLGHGNQYDAVFLFPLALLTTLLTIKKRNRKLEVDGAGRRDSDNGRCLCLYSVYRPFPDRRITAAGFARPDMALRRRKLRLPVCQ